MIFKIGGGEFVIVQVSEYNFGVIAQHEAGKTINRIDFAKVYVVVVEDRAPRVYPGVSINDKFTV